MRSDYSPAFLGTFFALGLGFLAGVSGFAYIAPVLSIINADIGPDPNITWVALVHPVALSVALTIVGRMTDIFGRRWFFIGAAGLAAVASIISACAQSVPMLIAGATIKAVAASGQLSCFYTISELVPMKYRYIASSGLLLFNLPGTAFAPAVSAAIIKTSPITWRAIFWLLTAINATSMALFFFFYHPPTFEDKQHTLSKGQILKKFDYIGTVLYSAGLVLFLLGLSWGGSLYPWADARVISLIVVGFCALVAFVVWEIWAPLSEPLIPVSLFAHRPWVVSVILSGIGAGTFYSAALIWPQLVRNLYANSDPTRTSVLACLSNLFFLFGQVVGGLLCKAIGRQKIQVTVAMVVGGALLATTAIATPNNMAAVASVLVIGITFIGYMEVVAMSNAIISIPDQREIGAAGGAAVAGRQAIAAVCQAVFNVVLANRVVISLPAKVVPAVVDAGLPESSVPDFMLALKAGKGFDMVKGITDQIVAAGVAASKWGYADAYKYVFLASLGFTGLGIVCCIMSPNVDNLMTTKVAATLGKKSNKKEEV